MPPCANRRCNRPSYDGKPGSYCSKSCKNGQHSNKYQVMGVTCKSPWCKKPPFDGLAGNYCSRGCKNAQPRGHQTAAGAQCAATGCTKPPYPGGSHCSRRCRDGAGQVVPRAPGRGAAAAFSAGSNNLPFGTRLTPGHPKFIEISNQFNSKWGGSGFASLFSGSAPTIKEIWVVLQNHLDAKHQQYRQNIGNVKCKGSGQNPANTQRRFHQTTMLCNYSGTACGQSGCAVCSIITTGFSMAFVGGNAGTRFGAGLYSTSTPSKAYGYGNQRGMFVVSVACGKADKSTCSGALPAGTHSRVADSWSDEIVVFDDAAMIPKYLLIFQ